MNLEIDCPESELLEAVVLGKADPQDARRIKSHLQRCASCKSAYQSLSSATMALPGNAPAAMPSRNLAGGGPAATPTNYTFLLPPVEADEIGRLGNYRVLRVLGQGGMGIVFQGEDISLRRPVALKVMRPEMNEDPEGWQRFLREARTMAAIKHDRLVTIYQAGQERDVVYFAMELLEGESLESWMKRVPAPGVADIVRLGRDIAVALAFIHDNNLIHRDIKPANIWLEAPNAQVKVLDLGLVRPITGDSKLTMSGMILGTPDYMSPEQARGDTVDARTDLFNLGCILYCMCTGRKPFEGPSFTAVLMALATETPTPAGQLNVHVPASLSSLVMQLLSRNPKKRPASAEEVIDRLDQIESQLHEQLVSTQPVKPLKRPKLAPKKARPSDTEVVRRRQRSRETQRIGKNSLTTIIVAGAILTGLALLAIAGAALWRFRPRPPQPPAQPVALAVAPAAETNYLTELKTIARENWPFTLGPDDGPKGGGPKGGGPRENFKDFKKDPNDKPPGRPGKEFDTAVRHKGQISPHGIFMHPPVPPFEGQPASLTYQLGKQFQSFQAVIAINNDQQSEAPCIFWVYGDGKILWKSNPVSTQADTQKCLVSVKGLDTLKIAVTCSAPPRGAHAVWIEPFVAK